LASVTIGSFPEALANETSISAFRSRFTERRVRPRSSIGGEDRKATTPALAVVEAWVEAFVDARRSPDLDAVNGAPAKLRENARYGSCLNVVVVGEFRGSLLSAAARRRGLASGPQPQRLSSRKSSASDRRARWSDPGHEAFAEQPVGDAGRARQSFKVVAAPVL
jgi:hypothetical protein